MSGQGNLGRIDWQEIGVRKVRDARIDYALQLGVAAISIASMFLLAMTEPWQRWGYVIGLLGQPLWFASTWRANQFGMFVVSIFYTAALILGVANRFTFF